MKQHHNNNSQHQLTTPIDNHHQTLAKHASTCAASLFGDVRCSADATCRAALRRRRCLAVLFGAAWADGRAPDELRCERRAGRCRGVDRRQRPTDLLRCVERSDGAELESEKSEPQPVPGTPGVPGFRNPAAAQPQRWFRR